MKILLHALVGYLAVTALPFHPFAFASESPLAIIDYDGYVNTTQKHSDSALMRRASDDIIEERQAAAYTIPGTLAVIALIGATYFALRWIHDDDPKREAFTQNTITNTISHYPTFNWVICHSPYSVNFDGVEGTDWGYTHHELGISFARTIGYDLYWAKSGTFYRYGDGGFINWAYNGNILGTDNSGATVHFGTIS